MTWINVKERLPVEDTYVLLYAQIELNVPLDIPGYVCVGKLISKDPLMWSEDEDRTVTHWMPLPEPPKED